MWSAYGIEKSGLPSARRGNARSCAIKAEVRPDPAHITILIEAGVSPKLRISAIMLRAEVVKEVVRAVPK
jgi:hypothetical protein